MHQQISTIETIDLLSTGVLQMNLYLEYYFFSWVEWGGKILLVLSRTDYQILYLFCGNWTIFFYLSVKYPCLLTSLVLLYWSLFFTPYWLIFCYFYFIENRIFSYNVFWLCFAPANSFQIIPSSPSIQIPLTFNSHSKNVSLILRQQEKLVNLKCFKTRFWKTV